MGIGETEGGVGEVEVEIVIDTGACAVAGQRFLHFLGPTELLLLFISRT